MAASLTGRLSSLCFRAAATSFKRVAPKNYHLRCFSASVKLFAERRYTGRHEWVSVQNDVGTVGISDYAQDQLGEVVFVALPEVGQEFSKDDESSSVESVKAVSEVYSPVSGEVTDVNPLLADQPNLINEFPLDKGWLYKMKLSKPDELKELMDEESYKQYITSSD